MTLFVLMGRYVGAMARFRHRLSERGGERPFKRALGLAHVSIRCGRLCDCKAQPVAVALLAVALYGGDQRPPPAAEPDNPRVDHTGAPPDTPRSPISRRQKP